MKGFCLYCSDSLEKTQSKKFCCGSCKDKYKALERKIKKKTVLEIIKRIEEYFSNQDNIEAIVENLKKKFLKEGK